MEAKGYGTRRHGWINMRHTRRTEASSLAAMMIVRPLWAVSAR